jgi:nucleotide-binding universal stress UspA family protein
MIPPSGRDWCTPSTHLVHGKPYEQILAIAGDRAVDLIVIGVHGRAALDVALFGSTTNQVIRGARCPVLTIRP